MYTHKRASKSEEKKKKEKKEIFQVGTSAVSSRIGINLARITVYHVTNPSSWFHTFQFQKLSEGKLTHNSRENHSSYNRDMRNSRHTSICLIALATIG